MTECSQVAGEWQVRRVGKENLYDIQAPEKLFVLCNWSIML